MSMKKFLISILAILLILSMCVGCLPIPTDPEPSDDDVVEQPDEPEQPEEPEEPQQPEQPEEPEEPQQPEEPEQPEQPEEPEEPIELPDVPLLNGVELSEYVIVYGSKDVDYAKRAAEYIKDEIYIRTGLSLTLRSDAYGSAAAHEIVVGQTRRDISQTLDADTQGVEFALLADGASIAMEADYFVIAAAAYYFVNTYIVDETFISAVPEQVSICQPIVKPAKNYVLLIGDGMGVTQSLLYEDFSVSQYTDYSDGEDVFYGYLLPYQGYARTNSLSGVTDSAAAGTALATGFKTNNGYVGLDQYQKEVPSLTELAAGLGMATAVMSTEIQTGATPAAFSAHSLSRSDDADIIEDQFALMNKYGTIVNCDYDLYTKDGVETLENAIATTLERLSKDEDGFFLMYEEAYIDKHCHSNSLESTFMALVRFNQAIGLFMEYAMYHPDTFVLVTADHETGALTKRGDLGLIYGSSDHSNQNVPVFAYGYDADVFDNKTIENTQIPKTIAALFGVEIEGTLNQKYPSLVKIAE